MIEFKDIKNQMLTREKIALSTHNLNAYTNVPALFDVQVFYVRVSSCLPEEAPDSVIIRLPPRSIEIALEINGGRISPCEEACLLLRRDRMDPDSEEVIYVNTDKIRASESIEFEVYDRKDLLISGILQKLHTSNEIQVCEESAIVNMPSKAMTSGWTMKCSCGVGSSGCAFVKVRRGYTTLCAPPPSMEICVVGRCIDSPVILTQTIELTPRKRSTRKLCLDVIPEETDPKGMQEFDKEIEDSPNSLPAKRSKFYPLEDSFLDGEDGGESWFNAGVRVGVGIGLGISLGFGIGVGLLVGTYQTSSRSLRRKFL